MERDYNWNHLEPGDYDLKDARTRLELTQSEMARSMGMPLRSYQDVEAGKNPLRTIHVRAAIYAELDHAARTGKHRQLSADARGLAFTLADRLRQFLPQH